MQAEEPPTPSPRPRATAGSAVSVAIASWLAPRPLVPGVVPVRRHGSAVDGPPPPPLVPVFAVAPPAVAAAAAAGPPAVVAAPPLDITVWDAAALANLVEAQRYAEVMRALDHHMDTALDPRAANWCVTHGYCSGHVPVLYKLTRNLLKWRGGRVPTCEDLHFGFVCALLLLLRVAQDVEACRLDLAKGDREFVFPAFRDKVWSWVQPWVVAAARSSSSPAASSEDCTDDALPPVARVLAAVEQWLAQVHTSKLALPLPTWATAFQGSWLRSLGGAAFQWLPPAPRDVAAFQRCLTVTATRDAVAQSFVSFVRRQGTWERIFVAKLVDFVSSPAG